MKPLVSSIVLIVKRPDSRWVIISFTLLFLLLLLAVKNGSAVLEIFGFELLSPYKRFLLIISTFFAVSDTFTTGAIILAVLGSLLGGINISLAYTYMKLRGEILVRSGLYSGIGLVIAFLGLGCAACGIAALSVILAFLGLSAMFNLLPYQCLEIGYIGLIFLCIATYSLAHKVMQPAVC